MKNLVANIIFIVVLVLTIGSCVTEDPIMLESTTVTVQDENFNIQARYLAKDELLRNFGRENNPLVKDYSIGDSREFVVFEITIKNKTTSTVEFDLSAIEFVGIGGSMQPKNGFQILQYWDLEDKTASELDKMKKIMDRYLFDREFIVPSDGLKRGLIVYHTSLSRTSDFSVNIPVRGNRDIRNIYELVFHPY